MLSVIVVQFSGPKRISIESIVGIEQINHVIQYHEREVRFIFHYARNLSTNQFVGRNAICLRRHFDVLHFSEIDIHREEVKNEAGIQTQEMCSKLTGPDSFDDELWFTESGVTNFCDASTNDVFAIQCRHG